MMLLRYRCSCFTYWRYTRPAFVALLAFLLFDSALADPPSTDPGRYLETVKTLRLSDIEWRDLASQGPIRAAHYIWQPFNSGRLRPDLTVLTDGADGTAKQANTASKKPRHCSAERGAVSYPDSLRGSGIQGSVLLEVTVSSEGCTEGVKVIRKLHPALDKLAVEAVRSWKFTPATKDGHPVAVIVQLSVDFKDPGNGH